MTNSNTVTDIALSEVDGEPRALDLDIGKRLGLKRDRGIRDLIDRNKAELETFGPLAVRHGKSRGQAFTEYWLNEEQALLISVRSDADRAAEVRRMLIKVFVAYRRGHLAPVATLPPDVLEMVTRDFGISRQLSHKVKGIEETLAAIVEIVRPATSARWRNGKTAGEIWDRFNLPKLKNAPTWLGNRLVEMGCMADRFDFGRKAIRLFDPDRAEVVMKNGLLHRTRQYVSERQGQGKLRLVGEAHR